MLSALQRQLIYFPETAAEADLLRQADQLNLEGWRDARGELIGWRQAGRGSAKQRILVFHGNAGYAQHRQYYVTGLQSLGDEWEVFLFEYPGYGARPGRPSAENFKQSAAAALQQLLEEDDRPLYLIGESLGSGVATSLAARFPEQVAGLLLVTPFTSLADVGKRHYPILPMRALLSENYDSVKALERYSGPVAFLIAGRDEIVPTELGEELHGTYRGPKWLRVEAAAGHNTLPFSPAAPWWREASDFLLEAR